MTFRADASFNQSNWNKSTSLRFAAIDDDFVEASPLAFKCWFDVVDSESAENYQSAPSEFIDVIVFDSDVASVALNETLLTMGEGESVVTRLSSSHRPLLGSSNISFSLG